MGVCLGNARLCSTRTPAATDVEASRVFGFFWQETQKNVNSFRGKKTQLLPCLLRKSDCQATFLHPDEYSDIYDSFTRLKWLNILFFSCLGCACNICKANMTSKVSILASLWVCVCVLIQANNEDQNVNFKCKRGTCCEVRTSHLVLIISVVQRMRWKLSVTCCRWLAVSLISRPWVWHSLGPSIAHVHSGSRCAECSVGVTLCMHGSVLMLAY